MHRPAPSPPIHPSIRCVFLSKEVDFHAGMEVWGGSNGCRGLIAVKTTGSVQERWSLLLSHTLTPSNHAAQALTLSHLLPNWLLSKKLLPVWQRL